MPYAIRRRNSSNGYCSPSKPWALVKKSDGTVMGCHESKEHAQAQRRAIYASEERQRNDPGG